MVEWLRKYKWKGWANEKLRGKKSIGVLYICFTLRLRWKYQRVYTLFSNQFDSVIDVETFQNIFSFYDIDWIWSQKILFRFCLSFILLPSNFTIKQKHTAYKWVGLWKYGKSWYILVYKFSCCLSVHARMQNLKHDRYLYRKYIVQTITQSDEHLKRNAEISKIFLERA